jgi:hypothetical protein
VRSHIAPTRQRRNPVNAPIRIGAHLVLLECIVSIFTVKTLSEMFDMASQVIAIRVALRACGAINLNAAMTNFLWFYAHEKRHVTEDTLIREGGALVDPGSRGSNQSAKRWVFCILIRYINSGSRLSQATPYQDILSHAPINIHQYAVAVFGTAKYFRSLSMMIPNTMLNDNQERCLQIMLTATDPNFENLRYDLRRQPHILEQLYAIRSQERSPEVHIRRRIRSPESRAFALAMFRDLSGAVPLSLLCDTHAPTAIRRVPPPAQQPATNLDLLAHVAVQSMPEPTPEPTPEPIRQRPRSRTILHVEKHFAKKHDRKKPNTRGSYAMVLLHHLRRKIKT